jgi:hypothetical protein
VLVDSLGKQEGRDAQGRFGKGHSAIPRAGSRRASRATRTDVCCGSQSWDALSGIISY